MNLKVFKYNVDPNSSRLDLLLLFVNQLLNLLVLLLLLYFLYIAIVMLFISYNIVIVYVLYMVIGNTAIGMLKILQKNQVRHGIYIK